jgi:hypothetical protein
MSKSERPWYRLHASTWVVTLLAAALWTAVILAGERRTITCVEHGWPLPFLTREGKAFAAPGGPVLGEIVWSSTLSLWSWRGYEIRDVSRVALAADVGLAILGLTVLVTAIEWRRRRARHFWQLSLRELAAVTLAFAALCGWWGSIYRETQRQARTLKALDDLLGRFISDGTSSTIWISEDVRRWQSKGDWFLELLWDEDTKPRWFAEVVALRLSVGQDVADEVVGLVGQLPALEELSLTIYGGGRRLANGSVQTLAGLHRLRSLEIGRMGGNWDMSVIGLNDEQVAYLGRLPNLERLNLSHNYVTDEGLRHLRGLKRLELLEISNNAITDAGVDELRENLPGLLVLDD